MIKYIIYFVISFVLVYVQQSFLTAFDTFYNLNLLLVFLIFIAVIFGFNLSFIFTIFIGLFLSIYSYLPIGSFIIIYLIVLALVGYLHRNFLINLSFYTSLILMSVATIVYNILVLIFTYFFYSIGLINIYISLDNNYINNTIWQLILNLILMALVFLIAQATVKKLNLAFLFKK